MSRKARSMIAKVKSSTVVMVRRLALCRLHDGIESSQSAGIPWSPFLRYSTTCNHRKQHEMIDERGRSIRKPGSWQLLLLFIVLMYKIPAKRLYFPPFTLYPSLRCSILLPFSRSLDKSIQPILMSIQHRIGLFGGQVSSRLANL